MNGKTPETYKQCYHAKTENLLKNGFKSSEHSRVTHR